MGKPCKVGTVNASVQDSGALKVSITNVGGDELASLELKTAEETVKALKRKLKKQVGEDLLLMLPEGKLLGQPDHKTPLRELFGLPVAAQDPNLDSLDSEGDCWSQSLNNLSIQELPPLQKKCGLSQRFKVILDEKANADVVGASSKTPEWSLPIATKPMPQKCIK